MSQQPSQDATYVGQRAGARPQWNDRSLPPSNNPPYKTNGRLDESPEATQNRAARYEDEKRRIIESCFSKKEEDGVAAESYITHVRVIEDAAYPSNPPPPDSAVSNKKSRVILVAVRKTGRVRVHKARENPTGTFSIGKTWPLEELSSIQSYTNLVPRNNQEQLEKEWANSVGFIVTLGKSYFWAAPTAKEKDFFIGSLVKIYRKYTGGKVPELFGFATREIELLAGAPTTPNPQLPAQASSPPVQTIAPPPPIPAASERRPQTPQSLRSQGSDQTGRTPAQPHHEQSLPVRDAQRPPPIEPLRSPARNEDHPPNRDGRSQRSLDNTTRPQIVEQPPTPVYFQPPYSQPSPGPQPSQPSSQPSLHAEKTNGRNLNGAPRPLQPPYPEPQMSASNSMHSMGSRPSTAVSDQKSIETRQDKVPATGESPDRKKHYLGQKEAYAAPKSGVASETNSQFATPAATPSDLYEDKVPEFPLLNRKEDTHSKPIQQSKENFASDKSLAINDSASTEKVNTMQSVHTLATTSHMNPEPAETEAAQVPKKAEEEHRPGLGPMIKKKSAKDIAGQFRKAAMAANAFQPRQGGAGARLKALQDKDNSSSEPDGITGVVPAPLFRGMSNDTVKSSTPATPTTATGPEQSVSPGPVDAPEHVQIHRTVTEDSITIPDVIQDAPAIQTSKLPINEGRSSSPENTRSRSPERRRRQRQEADISRYCSALGVDPKLFEGKGADFTDLLTEFGWEGKLAENCRIEEFEADIKREIGRAQATGWLGHVEQQEGKVQDLAKAFDRAIEECEELDGLFTLYSHELDTLAADIDYIEAQSQGLQVQTANQKLLQNELNTLLRTLTIPSAELRGLQVGSLDSETGLETIERSLALLYKALATIDPDIRQNKIRQTAGHNPDRGGVGVYADTEIGQMRAVQEKKDLYKESAMLFVHRFNQHITGMFKRTSEQSFYGDRHKLWKYNAMMLFIRELNSFEWQTLISSYEMSLRGIYQTQFREYAMNQRKTARKPGSDEAEALFTTAEKEKSDETLASTAARKLTVKRGKTVKAGALRQQLGEKKDGTPDTHEVFSAVLKHQGSAISEEQNFIVCFFHLNSQANADFAEIVASKAPGQRKLPNLSAKQSYDPDRNMAKIVQGVIEGIYSFWLSDLQNLLDWALSMDPIQGVGVLVALEQCLVTYEETNQEYLTRTVRTIHERLTGLFHKFVDEQIRAIEETKVKVKKRKGVISFMRTFPLFSTVIEQMMPGDTASSEVLEVRFIVNDAYGKILKAMWESLSFIAKDDPSAGGSVPSTAPGGADPEDKEAMNYHILLIENMNHYLEEVDTMRNIVLDEWADKARQDFATHLGQYTDSVIRRPLGKWLDFVESTEAMMKNSEAGISGKPSHSRSTAKKVLSSHDNKEIKKGIETLKKRIEKHFGDLDEPTAASKNLIMRVFEECSLRYTDAHKRMQVIITKVYEGNLEIDWRETEAVAMFKK